MPIPSRDHRRDLLRANCSDCFGLCCVALSFQRSADFADDKPAGVPCVNLRADFGCGIHERLRPSGYKGCTVFDCFGAGQKIAQSTYRGVSWRDHPENRQQMFSVFPVMRDLHELLWYLTEAADLPLDSTLAGEVDAALASTNELTESSGPELLSIDATGHRRIVVALLGRASEQVRSAMPAPWKKSKSTRDVGPRSDLMGRFFTGTSLRGANLRGSYLIGADLREADLSLTDLIGADLRDARLQRADLSRSLFLTQQQVNSAAGDPATRLPPALQRPSH